MSKTDIKRTMRLVVSEGKCLLEKAHVGESAYNSNGSVQLEMFPNSIRDGSFIIFVQPNDSNFESIIEEIKKDNVKTVLDIRESPFLNFRNISRDLFLGYLNSSRTEYINVHKWMRDLQADTVKELFLKIEKCDDGNCNFVKKGLKNIVGKGPLVVFSDLEPKKDELVSYFQKELLQSDLKYLVHYMD